MATSPASTLNNDILLTIFTEIVLKSVQYDWFHTMDGELTALDTVRIASQVCSHWRECLLDSPGTWGKLIHLDGSVNYGSQRHEWMDCVITRAQSAPLWIYGDIRKPDPDWGNKRFDAFSYFSRLLASHWERIEHLSASIYRPDFDESSNSVARDDIRTTVLSRAPSLKFFYLDFSESPDAPVSNSDFLGLESKPSQFLFDGSSPMLETIKIRILMFYKLAPSSLSKIRRIYAVDPRTLTRLKDILSLLQHTPMIERFELDAISLAWGPEIPPFVQLSIPSLSSIKLKVGTLSLLARILDYIHPNPRSNLVIKTWKGMIDLGDSYIQSFLKKDLPFFISRFLISNRLTNVDISISDSSFKLSDDMDPDAEHFEVDIALVKDSASTVRDSLLCDLFDAVSLSSMSETGSSLFESVTYLTLQFLEVGSNTVEKLHSMLAVFTHVEHLETSEDYGAILSTLCDGPQGVLFPQLHTLHLTSCIYEDRTSTELSGFFLKRKNMGYPVAKFDLTGCWHSNYAQDLTSLEAVHGLEVVWRKIGSESSEGYYEISRYTCGEGNSKQLNNLIKNGGDTEDSE